MLNKINITTPNITLLLACDGPKGLFHFPNDEDPFPGINMSISHGLTWHDTMRDVGSEFLGKPELNSKILPIMVMEPEIEKGNDGSTLVLARIHKEEFLAPDLWPTLPALLHGMPKNKTRVPYLKAFQVLAGGLSQETQAVEMDEAFRQAILKNLDKSDSQDS